MHWTWETNAIVTHFYFALCVDVWIRRDRDIQIERKWNDVSKCFEL